MDFVGRDGQEITADTGGVDGVAPGGLYTVRMEQNAVLQADAPNIAHRILYAGFIVDIHDGHQPGICP